MSAELPSTEQIFTETSRLVPLMWIGSSKENRTKPLGIKWPKYPIKALGLYFSYDLKLLKEKNFIERLDSIKKLINIWSSRGL